MLNQNQIEYVDPNKLDIPVEGQINICLNPEDDSLWARNSEGTVFPLGNSSVSGYISSSFLINQPGAGQDATATAISDPLGLNLGVAARSGAGAFEGVLDITNLTANDLIVAFPTKPPRSTIANAYVNFSIEDQLWDVASRDYAGAQADFIGEFYVEVRVYKNYYA